MSPIDDDAPGEAAVRPDHEAELRVWVSDGDATRREVLLVRGWPAMFVTTTLASVVACGMLALVVAACAMTMTGAGVEGSFGCSFKREYAADGALKSGRLRCEAK